MDHRAARYQEFLAALRPAAKKMGEHFFQLPVAGSNELIYRERVYCYELYHQLKLALPPKWPYQLAGEVDKGGHPLIREEVGARKPDFIVHVPGQMGDNLVVVEVKPATAKEKGVKKDFDTLQRFVCKAQYFRGIMLFYGQDNASEIESLVRRFRPFPKNIEVFWHPGHGVDLETL
jgi:hypothetical protein